MKKRQKRDFEPKKVFKQHHLWPLESKGRAADQGCLPKWQSECEQNSDLYSFWGSADVLNSLREKAQIPVLTTVLVLPVWGSAGNTKEKQLTLKLWCPREHNGQGPSHSGS